MKKKISQRLLSAPPIAWFRQSACPPTIRSHETVAHDVRGVFSWLGDVGHAVRAACGATLHINVTTAPEPVSSAVDERARSGCIDDERLSAVIAGAIAGDELASIDRHLARCALCRSVLADAAHGVASTVADPQLPIEISRRKDLIHRSYEDCNGTGSTVVAR